MSEAVVITQQKVWDIGTLSWVKAQQALLSTDNLTVTLPSTAATTTRQDTGNTSLASIDGKITTVNTGAVAFASPQHVVVDSGAVVSNLNTPTGTVLQNAMGGAGDGTTLTVAGYAAVFMDITVGGSGSIRANFEGSADGLVWRSVNAIGPTPFSAGDISAAAGVSGFFVAPVAGLTYFRARASNAFGSPSLTVVAYPTTAYTDVAKFAEVTSVVGIQGAGQTTMGGSFPVAIASDQTGLPITNDGTFAKETGGNLASIAAAVNQAQGASAGTATGPALMGTVSDTVVNGLTLNTMQLLQLAADGRLRVQTASESSNNAPWGDPYAWGDTGMQDDAYPSSAW